MLSVNYQQENDTNNENLHLVVKLWLKEIALPGFHSFTGAGVTGSFSVKTDLLESI